MSDSPSVLILGAGNYQIDAIEYCLKSGYRVFACSYRDTDPGISLADGFRKIDIRDIDGVIEYARDEKVSAVYSVGSDLAIPTAIKASEILGLPHFISYETACICQDKSRMRSILADTPWSIPFTVAQNADEAKRVATYPAMMKPVDSQGQRGCYKVECDADIDAHFEQSMSFSQTGSVILERFIDGPEISVNAFLKDGSIVFFMPSDRYSYTEFPGGIIKEHGLPCRALDEEGLAATRTLIDDVVRRVGIEQGPVYFQIKLVDQHPYVIEVTPRLDGCHMWRFINHYCGYNLLADTFSLLLKGETAEQPPITPLEGDWRLKFLNAAPHTIFNRSAYDVSNASYLQWYYDDGDEVQPLNGYMEKGGYQICPCI